jgi:hypothetical protein
MASRVELLFEKVATLPQAKTTPQINPLPPKSNPGHGGRLRILSFQGQPIAVLESLLSWCWVVEPPFWRGYQWG